MRTKLLQNRFFLFAACFAIVLVLITLHLTKLLRPFENLILKIFTPVGAATYTLGNKVSNLVSFFGSIKDLGKENRELKLSQDKLLMEVAKLKEVEKENNELREQLSYQKKSSFKLIPAFVVNRDPNNLLQSISINRGEKDGVKAKAAVVALDGILVGRVTEVYKDYSKALLVVDSHSNIPAKVQDSQADGIVLGEHGLGLLMEMIPQDKVIKRGDIVITSDLDQELPAGLLIGEIEEINNSDNELFQKARIKSPIDFKELNSVFVIKNN
jgi:rod shape-determining protein MreC